MPRSVAGCARRSRSCGTRRRSGRLRQARSTRFAAHWQSSTNRSSWSRRASTGRWTGRGQRRRRQRRQRWTASGQGVPALGIVDRRRSRRQPERDRGDDARRDGHPGRSRPARLRAGLSPPRTDDHHSALARATSSKRGSRPTMPSCPKPRATSTAATRTSHSEGASAASPSGCAELGSDSRPEPTRRRASWWRSSTR